MDILIYLYPIIMSQITVAQTFGMPLDQSHQFKNELISATLTEKKLL